jgi:hypothetical protein
MLDKRIGFNPPSQYLTWGVRGTNSIPFHRRTGRACHDPARAAIAEVLDVAHVRHDMREVLIMGPKLQDVFDRSMNVDSLLNVDGTSASPHTEQLLELDIRNGARQRRQARGTESTAKRITPAPTIIATPLFITCLLCPHA